MTGNDVIKVEFSYEQNATANVIVEIEPSENPETVEQTIARARQELNAQGSPFDGGLCAHCSGYNSIHQSEGGDGKYSLDIETDLGKEIEATILTGDCS